MTSPPVQSQSPLAALLWESRRRLIATLVWGQVVMGLLHMFITWAPTGTFPKYVVNFVHLDREGNLPTWFSAAGILLLALVLIFIAVVEGQRCSGRRIVWRWSVCAIITIWLSADEASGFHEMLGTYLKYLFAGAAPGSIGEWLRRFPSYYWVMIYIPIAVPLFVMLGRFVWREVPDQRWVVIVGVAIYLGGTVVLDHIEGRYGDPKHGLMSFMVFGQIHHFDEFLVEEMMEMAGVTILIWAFTRHVVRLALELGVSRKE